MFTPCQTHPWFTTKLRELIPALDLAQRWFKFPVWSYLALCLIFCFTYIECFSLWSPELFILYPPCYCGSYLQASAWLCSNCMYTRPGIHKYTDQIIAELDQLLLLRTFPSSFPSLVSFQQVLQFTETLLRNQRWGPNSASSAKAWLQIHKVSFWTVFKVGMQISCLHSPYGTLRDFAKQKRQKVISEKRTHPPPKKKETKAQAKTLARSKN